MFFLDCEASSLNDDSYPIEIAWVDEVGHGETYLIRPDRTWTDWSAKAETIHHISLAMLYRDGTPVSVVAQRVTTALANQTIVSDNPSWDAAWVTRLLTTVGHQLSLPMVDIDRIMQVQIQRLLQLNKAASDTSAWHREARRLLDHGQSLVGGIRDRTIIRQNTRHRALPDAMMLWRWWHDVKTQIDGLFE